MSSTATATASKADQSEFITMTRALRLTGRSRNTLLLAALRGDLPYRIGRSREPLLQRAALERFAKPIED